MQKQSPQKHLKVLLCQLNPVLKQKAQNIARVKKSLQIYSPKDQLDIILFPELSFTGYNFKDFDDALPQAITYADKHSQQFKFASREAIRLKCYVIFGYIEREEVNNTVRLYNSAAVVDRHGEPILNVRKTHLYYNDELWCTEGDGFKTLEVTNLKGETFRTVLGICMDINPKHFTSGQHEWADFAKQQRAEVLLFLTNWVDSQAESIEDSAVLAMYNYWLYRLRPLTTPADPSNKEEKLEPVLFFAADRVGKQYSFYDKKQTEFFGSSCALHLNQPYLIQKLPKKDEGYLMVEAKLPAKAVQN